MNPIPKPRRPQGRLGQCNKIFRLRRRALGQWQPEPQVSVKEDTLTRYALEEALWREK